MQLLSAYTSQVLAKPVDGKQNDDGHQAHHFHARRLMKPEPNSMIALRVDGPSVAQLKWFVLMPTQQAAACVI